MMVFLISERRTIIATRLLTKYFGVNFRDIKLYRYKRKSSLCPELQTSLKGKEDLSY